jgi:FkbM family methyltransferase
MKGLNVPWTGTERKSKTMIKALSSTLRFILNHPLNARRKWAAVYSFVAWQVKSRLNKGIHEVIWINGVRLAVRNGMNGATGAIYTGLPEFSDMGFVVHFLKEKDLFIDVGANVGIYTLLASGVKGASSVAFEPVADTFDSLERNIVLNGITDKVKAWHMGVGSKKDTLHFTKGYDTVNHVVFDQRADTIEVLVDQLDKRVDLEENDSESALMKIDVEGFEMEVLKGGGRLLNNRKLKAVIMEMNGCGEQFGISDEELDKEITAYGFEKYDYDPISRKLTALNFYNSHGNTIYLRDMDYVHQRLVEAKKVTVFNIAF